MTNNRKGPHHTLNQPYNKHTEGRTCTYSKLKEKLHQATHFKQQLREGDPHGSQKYHSRRRRQLADGGGS
jgi:hypothetical protein